MYLHNGRKLPPVYPLEHERVVEEVGLATCFKGLRKLLCKDPNESSDEQGSGKFGKDGDIDDKERDKEEGEE